MTEPTMLARRILALEQVVAAQTALKGGGGNGTFGGMETRVAHLEATVGHIQSDVTDIKAAVARLAADVRSDFRWLVAGIAAVALLGLGAVAWVNGKFDQVNARFEAVNTTMNAKFESLTPRFDAVNARVDAMGDRITRLEAASERLRADILERLPPPAKPQP